MPSLQANTDEGQRIAERKGGVFEKEGGRTNSTDLFLKPPALRSVNMIDRVFPLASASREHFKAMFS